MNPMDRIEQLEAENQRLREQIDQQRWVLMQVVETANRYAVRSRGTKAAMRFRDIQKQAKRGLGKKE